MKAFHNWVNSQIRYPAEAFKNNLGGKVVAQFTVDQAGSVGDIKILQSPDKCFSDEVTRILESSPKINRTLYNPRRTRIPELAGNFPIHTLVKQLLPTKKRLRFTP